jgi:hypothetical protein
MSFVTLFFGAATVVLGILVLRLRRENAALRAAARPSVTLDPTLDRDDDLDARIIEYVATNDVYHINDACEAIEHTKGSRFVRGHFHKLMDEGKITYRELRYRV